MSEQPGAAWVGLAAVIAAHREELVDRLVELEWAADASRPAALIKGAEAVRPRVELFIDFLTQGLATGD